MSLARVAAVSLTRLYPSLAPGIYRRLWIGIIPYHLCFQVGLVATGTAAIALSRSALEVGLMLGAWGLPILFMPPFGGVAADRSPRLRTMLAAQVVLGSGALTVGILGLMGQLTVWEIIRPGRPPGVGLCVLRPGQKRLHGTRGSKGAYPQRSRRLQPERAHRSRARPGARSIADRRSRPRLRLGVRGRRRDPWRDLLHLCRTPGAGAYERGRRSPRAREHPGRRPVRPGRAGAAGCPRPVGRGDDPWDALPAAYAGFRGGRLRRRGGAGAASHGRGRRRDPRLHGVSRFRGDRGLSRWPAVLGACSARGRSCSHSPRRSRARYCWWPWPGRRPRPSRQSTPRSSFPRPRRRTTAARPASTS